MKISKRADIPPFFAMEVLRAANERAAQGEVVMHLEAGEPGSGPPRKVIEAAHRALDSAHLGYTESLGMPALRQRIAQHYADYYGAKIPVERIMITTGSSGGFILSFIAAFDVGDRIALVDPSYPAYRNMCEALGIEIVRIPAGLEHRYQPTVELLEASPSRPDGLIIASPSNPTGTVIERARLEAVMRYCEMNKIRVISDEIYHGITYGERAETALKFSDHAIVTNGFSKYYAMTGWRLGWMVVPEDLVRPIERLAQNFFISPPAIAQYGALAAFDCVAELDANVARYGRNRAMLIKALGEAGFGDLAPCDGAFYLYADVLRLTNDSEAFCKRMLSEVGIAATPGIDFDRERGRRFVRFSFAGPGEQIEAACGALKKWLGASG
ncbi:MAG: aminotransferase class I/II-fold pyridoxal phosphate-dependent enzyme [Alphaproteobacteria bacterium]|nr:aminotransferase class I/II-fold pyridoxal phosphate-dependent enzyme [Alphaproteobacteria bacterium]